MDRMKSFSEEGGVERILTQEKERLLKENIELKKQLNLSRASFNGAKKSFEKTFQEQAKYSELLGKAVQFLEEKENKLESVNKELTTLKDSLVQIVEERTKELEESNKKLGNSNNVNVTKMSTNGIKI